MGKYSVSELLGEETKAAPRVKKRVQEVPTWQAGLDAARDGWKAKVTTDLDEVQRAFIQSRRTGTDGARRKNTPVSIKNYETDLKVFFAYLRSRGVTSWELITRPDVQGFVGEMNKRLDSGELASASVWKMFRTMRAIFSYTEKQQDHTWTSFRTALPAIPKNTGRTWIPSPEQMRAYMEGFDRDTVWGFRDYVMSTVMLDCGARIGELCNLTVSDILWDANMVVLFGKKQRVRKVSLSETKTMPLLRQWGRVRERISKCDKFFTTRNGGRLAVNELNKSFRKNRVATGIGNGGDGAEDETITPHVFRHYFCTRYLVNGGKVEVLQQITGHEDFSTLQGYMHLAAELSYIKEEHRRVSPLDSLYNEDTKKKRRMVLQ